MYPPERRPLEWFRRRMADKEPTTFTRWGDGEWTAVLGRRRTGANCDGHPFYPKMGSALKQVLLGRPGYVLGMQSLAVRVVPGVEPFVRQNYLDPLDWVDADVFHHASADGSLASLVAEMRKVPVVLIGPPHLHQPLKDVLHYAEHVMVPPKNCFLSLPSLVTDALGVLDRMPRGTVAAVSASMPAKLLIDALHRKMADRHHLIDFGSVWDFYAGVQSRKYMQGMARGGRDGQAELRS